MTPQGWLRIGSRIRSLVLAPKTQPVLRRAGVHVALPGGPSQTWGIVWGGRGGGAMGTTNNAPFFGGASA